MRTRHLGRRRTDPATNPGSDLPEFEFAHLLDAVSWVEVDAVPDVVPALETKIAPVAETEVVPVDETEVIPVGETEVIPDVEPEVVPEVVLEVAVSRFADAGLDDDRLPVTVKRRGGRRR